MVTHQIEEDTVLTDKGDLLPVKFSDGGSDTIFSNNKAYYWDTDVNCETELLTFAQIRMVHWLEPNKFFIINENIGNYLKDKDKNQGPQFRIEVKKEVEYLCDKGQGKDEENIMENIPSKFLAEKKIIAQKTNHENLFVTILLGGFDMETGKTDHAYANLKKAFCQDRNRKICEQIQLSELKEYLDNMDDGSAGSQYFTEYQSLSSLADILLVISNQELINNSVSTEVYKDLYTHSMNQLDFNYYKLRTIAKTQDMEIIRMMCELERQVMLTVLQLATINDKIAGKLLTGKDSYFFKISDDQGWLSKCEKVNSPWIEQDKCYDKIPVVYKGVVQFIDPKSRKISDPILVNEVDCIKEARTIRFQLDPENEESWYSLIPHLVHKDSLKIFSPFITKMDKKFNNILHESINTGIYNKEDMQELYNKIQQGERKEGLFKIMIGRANYSINGMTEFNGKNYWNRNMKRNLYFDEFISPSYFDFNFKKHIMNFFGFIHYTIITFGGYFGTVMFVYVIILAYKAILVGTNCFSLRKSNLYDNLCELCCHAFTGTHNSHKVMSRVEDYGSKINLLSECIIEMQNKNRIREKRENPRNKIDRNRRKSDSENYSIEIKNANRLEFENEIEKHKYPDLTELKRRNTIQGRFNNNSIITSQPSNYLTMGTQHLNIQRLRRSLDEIPGYEQYNEEIQIKVLPELPNTQYLHENNMRENKFFEKMHKIDFNKLKSPAINSTILPKYEEPSLGKLEKFKNSIRNLNSKSNEPECYFCHKKGHTTLDCSEKTEKMLVTKEIEIDENEDYSQI